jgi:hypothetical protein
LEEPSLPHSIFVSHTHDDQAIGRVVERLVELRLELGGRGAVKRGQEQPVDRQMIARASRHEAGTALEGGWRSRELF